MKNLRRILELAKRTGDRFIVADPDGEDAFVVMGLDQYEGLLGQKTPSKAPQLPNTNSQLPSAGPRLRQDRDREPEPKDEDAPPPDLFDLMKPANEPGDTWDIEKMTEGEREEVLRQFMAYQGEGVVGEGTTAGTGRNEAKKDSFDEDQFYLEPVE